MSHRRVGLPAGTAPLACVAAVHAEDAALPAPLDASLAAADADGEIAVLGFGEARQASSATAADAFGACEWSTRISIRGFHRNRLAFPLDGAPPDDMS